MRAEKGKANAGGRLKEAEENLVREWRASEGAVDGDFLPIRASAEKRGCLDIFGSLRALALTATSKQTQNLQTHTHTHIHTPIDADDAECEWAAARLSAGNEAGLLK